MSGKLGFGLMRLPKDGDAIDIEQTKTMVDMFMDAGFTYFDTAWAYEGSEDAIREALVERYPRSSYRLATKNAAWIKCEKREDAEFVQLQINYADWESPSIQSRRCYEVARDRGLPVIVMEPVKGGMLANPPDAVKAVLEEAEPGSSPSSWALRFAADLDGVNVVLSGMSDIAQMEENIRTLKGFEGMSDSERKTMEKAAEVLASIDIIPCTSCEYCAKVCPKGIGISGSFQAMNMLTLYGNKDMAAHQLGWLVDGHGKLRADQCIKCGKCEKACPQHIPIIEELEKVAGTFRSRRF